MAEIREMTAAEFDRIVKQGEILAFFYAPWCGHCRTLGEVLKSVLSQFPGEMTVAKISIEAEPGLASRFGVMTVPHLILFRSGERIREAVGVQSRSALLGLLDL